MKSTKNTINDIFSKFSEEKITSLKTHKVRLSLMDNIEEYIGNAYGSTEFFDEAYDEARKQGMLANDILRFDFNDQLGGAEDELDRLLTELKQLGVDIPPRVKEMQKSIQDLLGMQKEMEGKIRDL